MTQTICRQARVCSQIATVAGRLTFLNKTKNKLTIKTTTQATDSSQ